MKEIKYIIGIDWGERHCGIAIADSEMMIASGFGECERKDLINKLNEIAKKMEITEVVMGISSIVDNDQQNESIKRTANQIKEAGYSVKMEDEIFSTKMAQKHLRVAQKKKISKNDNIESARIILQGWIDKNM